MTHNPDFNVTVRHVTRIQQVERACPSDTVEARRATQLVLLAGRVS